jgi:CheY-like chemotaxis protein
MSLFDLALVDVVMPGIDGMQALEVVRQLELTRFRGHCSTWERGVHDAKVTPRVST